jgi:cell division protein FtsI/penicillin-binding protein 2
MVTLSAALDEGVVVPTTTFNTNGKFFVEGRRTPITEDKGHNYGPLTVEGILVHSSNIGAAMIGLQMGSDRMLRYAEMFGFTKSMASRDFYSEHLGIINAPKGVLTKASLATVAYGYGVVASPLQLATAMNVFATGGLLLRPHLVRAVIENGVRRTQEPEVVRRVISEETAATMTTMLEAVVETGTGTPAKLDRYRVAGKTGTTKKVMAGGGYSENDYRVSFVGFAPSRHPRFTIIVVIDEPTKLPAYGGAVSAPVFKEIAERSLNYVGETPSVNPPPAVIVAESRTPSARPSRPEPPPVFVNAVGVPTMPDLTGLTLRDALQRLPPGFTVTAQGDGVVVWQSLGAGEAIATDRFVLRLQSVPAKTGGASR